MGRKCISSWRLLSPTSYHLDWKYEFSITFFLKKLFQLSVFYVFISVTMNVNSKTKHNFILDNPILHYLILLKAERGRSQLLAFRCTMFYKP